MPLVDPNLTEEVVIKSDFNVYTEKYILKKQLGFYEKTKMASSILSASNLRLVLEQATGEKLSGEELAKIVDIGDIAAQRRFIRIKTYLVSWTHPQPITDETIKMIPTDHANAILDKIAELEAAPAAQPFQGE